MQVTRIRALRGPNLWSRHTAIQATVVCEPVECHMETLAHFEQRLRARFPEIDALRPNGRDEPITLAHVLELAALDLQEHAGCPVSFSATHATEQSGVFLVVVEYTEEQVGRRAMELAEALCRAAMEDTPFDLADALRQLRDLDEDVRLGPSTGAIVAAAVQRGVPYRRLTTGSLVQFGWGSRQRRIQAAETDRSSAIGESIAQDKELTKMLLSAAGVPVPTGRPVMDIGHAWETALDIGLPVVVKPVDGNQGKGVTVNITTREHLEIAFEAAREISSEIMIEKFIPGHDYRLLVVNNQVVAAARRDPPFVIGDGQHTVRELVEIVNADPRRGEGHATSLTKIRLDDIAIARLATQGHTVDSVPSFGTRVILRNNANLSTGGSATDVTDDVHPEVAARAIEAARMIGLDIAGVDVVCESIMKPLEEQGGGIVEVNAAPGLRMHLTPSFGKGRPVGEAIVGSMFEPEDNGRIPLVAVTGTNGKTTTVRLVSHCFATEGYRVGMTNSDGVYINGRRIDTGDCSGPISARSVLLHPDVDAAVLETARGGILREGLAFDRCKVAVVTNIGIGDHLGLNHIMTTEQLAAVKRVIVQNVAHDGFAVLNACDPFVADMAAYCPGKIIFFAADPHHPIAAAHRAQGNRLVYLHRDEIVAVAQGFEQRIPVRDIPLTRNGTVFFQVENAMAAIAAAWGAGIGWKAIVKGLATFVNDAETAPGRFNFFDFGGATVIADYGHNPDAIAALMQTIERMPARRRSVVISGAGDRRDEDIRRQSEILGNVFEEVILYEDQCQRGRSDGEVIALLREGLAGATRAELIHEIKGEFVAIDTALAGLRPGDLCLILVDQVEAALDHIARRAKEYQQQRQGLALSA